MRTKKVRRWEGRCCFCGSLTGVWENMIGRRDKETVWSCTCGGERGWWKDPETKRLGSLYMISGEKDRWVGNKKLVFKWMVPRGCLFVPPMKRGRVN